MVRPAIRAARRTEGSARVRRRRTPAPRPSTQPASPARVRPATPSPMTGRGTSPRSRRTPRSGARARSRGSPRRTRVDHRGVPERKPHHQPRVVPRQDAAKRSSERRAQRVGGADQPRRGRSTAHDPVCLERAGKPSLAKELAERASCRGEQANGLDPVALPDPRHLAAALDPEGVVGSDDRGAARAHQLDQVRAHRGRPANGPSPRIRGHRAGDADRSSPKLGERRLRESNEVQRLHPTPRARNDTARPAIVSTRPRRLTVHVSATRPTARSPRRSGSESVRPEPRQDDPEPEHRRCPGERPAGHP